MQLKGLWEVYGPSGRFDDNGYFVPTEKYGVLPSLFMNLVILPMAVVYFAFWLSLEFLPRSIVRLIEKRPQRASIIGAVPGQIDPLN